MHIDMDMFYAAVELIDKPHLKDLPVAIGNTSMISTANYVARKYGVRSAMPGFIALKLCPKLIFLSHNFNKYNHSLELTIDHIQGIPLYFLYKNRLITQTILTDLFSILNQFHSHEGTIQIQEDNIKNNYFKRISLI